MQVPGSGSRAQPVQQLGAGAGPEGAVHVLGLAVQLQGALPGALPPALVVLANLAEVLADRLGPGDAGAERHRAPHGPFAARVLYPRFGQGPQAADDADALVQGQLLALPHGALHALRDDGLVHPQHDDPVVGQELLVHRVGEVEHMQVLPVDSLVVHGYQLGALLLGDLRRARSVDPGGGRHVEPLLALDLVVDAGERGRLLARQGHARGAVGLVADDQVEGRQAVLALGVDQHLDGVVGREDHRHPLGALRARLPRQGPGVGGRREGQLMALQLDRVAADLAHLRVGAHREGPDRLLGLVGPSGDRLRHQRQGGHHQQRPAACARHALGDEQAGKGLPRAAGHDQLAPVRGLQALEHVLHGLVLVGPGAHLPAMADMARADELGPFDGACLQGVQPDVLHRRVLAAQGVLRRPVQPGAGLDQHAPDKALLGRFDQELVDLGARDLPIERMELALHRAPAGPVGHVRDQVDAHVLARAALVGRPLGEGAHALEVPGDVVAQPRQADFLEQGALVPAPLRVGFLTLQQLIEAIHGIKPAVLADQDLF